MRSKKLSLGLTLGLAGFALTLLMAGTRAAAQVETVLYSFGEVNTDASGPYAGLIFDASGNLYSTTEAGGTYGFGTVFKLTPQAGGGWTETVLHSFGNGTDGTYPFGSVIFGSAGKLYGTTSGGGVYNQGTVFALEHTKSGGWAEKVVHSFNNNGQDGLSPRAGVIFDRSGNLYGTTSSGGAFGCGTVFELELGTGGTGAEKILHSFNEVNGSDGCSPYAGLVFDGAGNLYGTTISGGTTGLGTAFELTPTAVAGWKERVLYNFKNDGVGGYTPNAGVIFADGKLYGATRWGGPSSFGTVFELTSTGGGIWTEQVLHGFGSGTDGTAPEAGVILSGAGNLYGTAQQGGANGAGIVFELVPAGGGSWTENVLHNFNINNFTDGGLPWAGVILDSGGNLYGATVNGGALGSGAVFEITP